MSNSTVFTVGSALRQAENDDAPVGVLVDGHWFAGTIAGLDGDGLLLDAEDGEVLVRLTAISVVRKLRRGAQEASATAQSAIAPVLSITREEPESAEPVVVEPVLVEPVVVERVPSVAEQLASRTEGPIAVEPIAVEPIAVEPVIDDLGDQDHGPAGGRADDLVVAEAEAILAETDAAAEADVVAVTADEPPVLSEEDAALLQFLPDDLTDDERFALIRRRALLAQQAAAAGADPAAIVAQLTGTAPETDGAATPDVVAAPALGPDGMVAAEPAGFFEPAEIPVEDNPLVHSSTQTDDWRAMLVSLRQQAADSPPSAEPEKRRSWRLAR